MDVPGTVPSAEPGLQLCPSQQERDVKYFGLVKSDFLLFMYLFTYLGLCVCQWGGTGRGTPRSRRDPSQSTAHGHRAEVVFQQRSN